MDTTQLEANNAIEILEGQTEEKELHTTLANLFPDRKELTFYYFVHSREALLRSLR